MFTAVLITIASLFMYDNSAFSANTMCCACMSFDQWQASISEPSEEEDDFVIIVDDEDFIEEEVESIDTPEESFEVPEDYEFEVTDFGDLQMALDYFADQWTRMDLDNPDELAQHNFNFNRYPE